MAKHRPFTSEPSNPHTSKAEPREHVDVHHFGEDGKKDDRLTVAHVIDPGYVEYGRAAARFRAQRRKQKPEPAP